MSSVECKSCRLCCPCERPPITGDTVLRGAAGGLHLAALSPHSQCDLTARAPLTTKARLAPSTTRLLHWLRARSSKLQLTWPPRSPLTWPPSRPPRRPPCFLSHPPLTSLLTAARAIRSNTSPEVSLSHPRAPSGLPSHLGSPGLVPLLPSPHRVRPATLPSTSPTTLLCVVLLWTRPPPCCLASGPLHWLLPQPELSAPSMFAWPPLSPWSRVGPQRGLRDRPV